MPEIKQKRPLAKKSVMRQQIFQPICDLKTFLEFFHLFNGPRSLGGMFCRN